MTFKKRKHNTPNLEILNIDNEPASKLRKYIRAKDFGLAEQIIAQACDTNQRTYLLEAAADWSTTIPVLIEWATTNTQTSQLVAAIHRAKMSWNHSNWTHGASNPTLFKAELDDCTIWFDRYASLNPNDASVYYWRIWLARASYNPELARTLHTDAIRTDPRNIFNASTSLYTESGSWFGNPELVLNHAHKLMAAVPREVGSTSLIVEAHYLNQFGNPSYWSLPQVTNNILEANNLNQIKRITTITDYRAAHWFAWGLSRIDRHDLASPYFEMLTGDSPSTPWGSMRFGLDAIFSAYKKNRKKALK